MRGSAEAARLAHNQKDIGSNPIHRNKDDENRLHAVFTCPGGDYIIRMRIRPPLRQWFSETFHAAQKSVALRVVAQSVERLSEEEKVIGAKPICPAKGQARFSPSNKGMRGRYHARMMQMTTFWN